MQACKRTGRHSRKSPMVQPVKPRNLNTQRPSASIWQVTDTDNGSAACGCGGGGCGGCFRKAPFRKR